MVNVFDGMAQKAFPQSSEFFDRVGCEKFHADLRYIFRGEVHRTTPEFLQTFGYHLCGRFRRIHDADLRRRNTLQQMLKERIVSTAEQQGVRIVEATGKGFLQVNASDLFSNWMFNPPLFHERHQQRAGLLAGGDSAGLERMPISVTAYRSLGSDDNDLLIFAGTCGGPSSGLDHADHWNADRRRDAIERERRSRIAGDHK